MFEKYLKIRRHFSSVPERFFWVMLIECGDLKGVFELFKVSKSCRKELPGKRELYTARKKDTQ